MATLQEFIDLCDHVNDLTDEDWCMRWLDYRRDRQTALLRVRLDSPSSQTTSQEWEIRCRKTRAFSVSDLEFTDWSLWDEHPLLWDYQKPIGKLFFRGPESRHENVLWGLYERHRLLAKHWIPFERYINDQFLQNGLSGGFGFLAEGPDHLLQGYAAVLADSDLEAYFPYPSREPQRWDGLSRRWIGEDRSLSAFVLGDRSYIVGEDFTAERVDESVR